MMKRITDELIKRDVFNVRIDSVLYSMFMQLLLKPSKATTILSLISLGLIAVGIFIFMRMSSNITAGEGSVCKSSQYSQIKVGMTKEQVIELWGKPSTERIKDSVDQNFFYQGANEVKIKEGWLYHSGQPDGAEIYFDSFGLVNGKNCGQG